LVLAVLVVSVEQTLHLEHLLLLVVEVDLLAQEPMVVLVVEVAQTQVVALAFILDRHL
jgi:hypothetical protein